MPPLNTTLIRGCSELQGPATQECLWHGSDFVAPSLCSLLGPILHLIFHPFSFFFELFWWKRWMKVWRLRHEEAMGTLSVVVWQGDWRHWIQATSLQTDQGDTLSFHHISEVKASASLHVIYLAEDFWGCFFICSTSCLSHLVVNSGIQDLLQNYVADSWCIFSSFFFFFSAHCLLWHAIPSHKQENPVAYSSC